MLSMTRMNIGHKPNSGIHNFAGFAKNYVRSYIYSSRACRLYVINVSILAGEPKIYDLFSLPQVRQTGG